MSATNAHVICPPEDDQTNSIPPELQNLDFCIINDIVWLGYRREWNGKRIWVPLHSDDGLRRIAVEMGAENATVNYPIAAAPYIKVLEQYARARPRAYPTVALCMGGRVISLHVNQDGRVAGEIMDKDLPATMSLDRFELTCMTKRELHDTMLSEQMVARFGMLSSYADRLALAWLLGGALLNPSSQPKCILLYGTGSNGKSTFATYCSTAFGPDLVSPLHDQALRAYRPGAPLSDRVVVILAGCRLAICGDVSGANHLDAHCVKIATGNDEVTAGHRRCRLMASILACTNSLMTPATFEGMGTPAMTRRLLVFDCGLIFQEGISVPPSRSQEHAATFISCLVNARMHFRAMPPLSMRSLLMTLLGDDWRKAEPYLRKGNPGCISGSIAAVIYLASLTQCTYTDMVRNLRLISPSLVYSIPGSGVECAATLTYASPLHSVYNR